ncbi:MAG: hypothetical protein MJ220_03805 [Bacilli bacterium]|nr:hypothetical protein [Bacilli bacterium]
MKKLRFYKTLDWILVALSYVAAVLLTNGALQYSKNPEAVAMMNPTRVYGVVFYSIVLVVQLVLYVMGFIHGIIAKESMAKHNMIVKIVSMPFFVINFFALSFLSFDVSEREVLLILLMIPLSVIATASIMLRSSLPNVVYFIKSYAKKTLKATPWAIVSLIMSFVFVLDVLAGIILCRHERNQRPDILARNKERKLKKVEKWKTKRHMSPFVFKVGSIIATAALSIASVSLIVITILAIVNAVNENVDIEVETLFTSHLFLISLIVVLTFSLVKLIFGVIYGKLGEEDPTKFLFVTKLVDLLPTIAILFIAFFLLVAGAALDVLSIMLIPVIAVVIIIFVIMAFLGFSIVMYASSLPFMASALFLMWSSSLTLFTYYMNQRTVKNRKFSNPLIVVCLVFLWIPVLDIIAMAIIRRYSQKNAVLGDKPVIVP